MLCNVQEPLRGRANGKSDDLPQQSRSDAGTISLAAKNCQLPVDYDVAVGFVPSMRKSKHLLC